MSKYGQNRVFEVKYFARKSFLGKIFSYKKFYRQNIFHLFSSGPIIGNLGPIYLRICFFSVQRFYRGSLIPITWEIYWPYSISWQIFSHYSILVANVFTLFHIVGNIFTWSHFSAKYFFIYQTIPLILPFIWAEYCIHKVLCFISTWFQKMFVKYIFSFSKSEEKTCH